MKVVTDEWNDNREVKTRRTHNFKNNRVRLENSTGRSGSLSALWCWFNELGCSFAWFAAGCGSLRPVGGCQVSEMSSSHGNAADVCGWI